MGVPEHMGSCDQIRASEIMGRNFLGVEEAVRHYDIDPVGDKFGQFQEVPWGEETLSKYKNTHLLVAVFPMTILEVQTKTRRTDAGKQVFNKRNKWFKAHELGRKDRAEIGWHLISKEEVPGSLGETFREGEKLLSDQEYLPEAVDLVYAFALHFLVTGERLPNKVGLRTASAEKWAGAVWGATVGPFYHGGLDIGYYYWNEAHEHLGMASAIDSWIDLDPPDL